MPGGLSCGSLECVVVVVMESRLRRCFTWCLLPPAPRCLRCESYGVYLGLSFNILAAYITERPIDVSERDAFWF